MIPEQNINNTSRIWYIKRNEMNIVPFTGVDFLLGIVCLHFIIFLMLWSSFGKIFLYLYNFFLLPLIYIVLFNFSRPHKYIFPILQASMTAMLRISLQSYALDSNVVIPIFILILADNRICFSFSSCLSPLLVTFLVEAPKNSKSIVNK